MVVRGGQKQQSTCDRSGVSTPLTMAPVASVVSVASVASVAAGAAVGVVESPTLRGAAVVVGQCDSDGCVYV